MNHLGMRHMLFCLLIFFVLAIARLPCVTACYTELDVEISHTDAQKIVQDGGNGVIHLKETLLSHICYIGGYFGLTTDTTVDYLAVRQASVGRTRAVAFRAKIHVLGGPQGPADPAKAQAFVQELVSPTGALNQPHLWYKYGSLKVTPLPHDPRHTQAPATDGAAFSGYGAAQHTHQARPQLPACPRSNVQPAKVDPRAQYRRQLLTTYSRMTGVSKKTDYSMLLYVVLPQVSLVNVNRDPHFVDRLRGAFICSTATRLGRATPTDAVLRSVEARVKPLQFESGTSAQEWGEDDDEHNREAQLGDDDDADDDVDEYRKPPPPPQAAARVATPTDHRRIYASSAVSRAQLPAAPERASRSQGFLAASLKAVQTQVGGAGRVAEGSEGLRTTGTWGLTDARRHLATPAAASTQSGYHLNLPAGSILAGPHPADAMPQAAAVVRSAGEADPGVVLTSSVRLFSYAPDGPRRVFEGFVERLDHGGEYEWTVLGEVAGKVEVLYRDDVEDIF